MKNVQLKAWQVFPPDNPKNPMFFFVGKVLFFKKQPSPIGGARTLFGNIEDVSIEIHFVKNLKNSLSLFTLMPRTITNQMMRIPTEPLSTAGQTGSSFLSICFLDANGCMFPVQAYNLNDDIIYGLETQVFWPTISFSFNRWLFLIFRVTLICTDSFFKLRRTAHDDLCLHPI